MFDDVVVVYKQLADVVFYITGSADENELILYAVLQAFHESVNILLRYAPACGLVEYMDRPMPCKLDRQTWFAHKLCLRTTCM